MNEESRIAEMSPYDTFLKKRRMARLARLLTENDTNYDTRRRLVYEFIYLAEYLGYKVGFDIDPKAKLKEFPIVVYVELPDIGQISYHLGLHSEDWDGHDTAEKLKRLEVFGAQLNPLPSHP